MNKNRFARLILRPSVGGVLAIIALALLIQVGAGILFVSKSGIFYEYLFGADSSTALIETSRSTLTIFSEMTLGNAVLNKILFFVFWMVVGLVVYTVVSGLSSGVDSVESNAEQSNYVHAQKRRMNSEFATKLVLRLIAGGLLLLYGVVFINILLPFGVYCARIVAGAPGDLMGWLYGLLGFTVLCASLYILMILVRFLLLRPRIFGGMEDIIEDELSQH